MLVRENFHIKMMNMTQLTFPQFLIYVFTDLIHVIVDNTYRGIPQRFKDP